MTMGKKGRSERGKRAEKKEEHAVVIKKAQSSSMYLCMLWSGFMCCVRAFVCVCVPLLTCTPQLLNMVTLAFHPYMFFSTRYHFVHHINPEMMGPPEMKIIQVWD